MADHNCYTCPLTQQSKAHFYTKMVALQMVYHFNPRLTFIPKWLHYKWSIILITIISYSTWYIDNEVLTKSSIYGILIISLQFPALKWVKPLNQNIISLLFHIFFWNSHFRCVNPEQRPFAIGMQFVILRLLGKFRTKIVIIVPPCKCIWIYLSECVLVTIDIAVLERFASSTQAKWNMCTPL